MKTTDKFRILNAGTGGPYFYGFETLAAMAETLMAWRVCGSHDKTASAWKLVRNQWVPMWSWQNHMGNVT